MTSPSDYGRILLLGGSGQLGAALRRILRGYAELVSPSSSDVPLTNLTRVRDFISECCPAVVLNAAAYTKVDEAESNPELANAVNALAPEAMALSSQAIGCRFLHVSTDYVFDGWTPRPYRTGAPTKPLNVYGQSKLSGERRVLDAYPAATIIRTAWIHAGSGSNFVGTAVRVLSGGGKMRVVDDQIGTPTHADTIASAILRILDRPNVRGLLHVTDAGVASWYDVACCVLDEMQRAGRAPSSAAVTPVDSLTFPRPAVRPKLSILDTYETRELLDWTPSSWQTGVRESTRGWLASPTIP